MLNRSKLSRRQVLRRGLGAIGATVACPVVIPGSALGLDSATAPSERISMGFTGLGGQGSGHLFGGAWTYLPGGYLARNDVQVLAVCDVQQTKADGAKSRVESHYEKRFGKGTYRAVTAYSDIRDMLPRDDIDAVLLAASYHAQGFMAMMAARAGKDVYCEKPVAATIRWGRALVEAVHRHGRVFQAGTQQRSEYDGKFRRAVELVRGGAIGTLKTVYAFQRGGGISPPRPGPATMPVPPNVNWDAYVGPLPWFPYRGSTRGQTFGFGDMNWGQHHYDIVQWGLGTDDIGPTEIVGDTGRPVFRFSNGVEVIGSSPPGEKWGQGGACFVGTEGSITVHRDRLTSDPPDVLRRSPGPAGHVYYSDSHSGNFLDCIRTRQRTICNVDVAHRAISLLLLGGIADRLRRTLKWDPQREEFLDDDEANRMLSIAPREGWRLG
jgi:predicted dehydrogenase